MRLTGRTRNSRADVLAHRSDHEAFLEALARTQPRHPFRLFGDCLMTNHVHLPLRPEPGQSIRRIMPSLTLADTRRHHARHRSVGHVWQGRFRSPVAQDGDHLLTVLRSIEANPLRAKMVGNPGDDPWSSFAAHGLGRPDPLLSEFPEWGMLGANDADGRRRWRRQVAAPRADAESSSVRESVRTGRPYETPERVDSKARGLNLPPAPRPRGRPRKVETV